MNIIISEPRTASDTESKAIALIYAASQKRLYLTDQLASEKLSITVSEYAAVISKLTASQVLVVDSETSALKLAPEYIKQVKAQTAPANKNSRHAGGRPPAERVKIEITADENDTAAVSRQRSFALRKLRAKQLADNTYSVTTQALAKFKNAPEMKQFRVMSAGDSSSAGAITN